MAKRRSGKSTGDIIIFGYGLIFELIFLLVSFFKDCFSDDK